jgi:hypothetical protein
MAEAAGRVITNLPVSFMGAGGPIISLGRLAAVATAGAVVALVVASMPSEPLPHSVRRRPFRARVVAAGVVAVGVAGDDGNTGSC